MIKLSNIITPSNLVTEVNQTVTSVASPFSWNSDDYTRYNITAQAGNITFTADNGTPINGQKVIFRIKDDGTPRTLSWTTGTSKGFRPIGIPLPTITVANKILYVGCMFNSADDRWDVLATLQE